MPDRISAVRRGPAARIEPCKLLTDDQVRAVVPDLASTMVMSAGESLMKGVDAYQCSYVNPQAEGLIVILNVAADAASFDQIKAGSSHAQKVDIGDAAWVYPKNQGLYVTVHKGRTVIDLHLTTQGAEQKSKALIELARTVAGEVS